MLKKRLMYKYKKPIQSTQRKRMKKNAGKLWNDLPDGAKFKPNPKQRYANLALEKYM